MQAYMHIGRIAGCAATDSRPSPPCVCLERKAIATALSGRWDTNPPVAAATDAGSAGVDPSRPNAPSNTAPQPERHARLQTVCRLHEPAWDCGKDESRL